jgi:hypothetical protein
MTSAYTLILRNPTIRVATLALLCHGVTLASIIPYQSVIGIGHYGMSDTFYSVFMFAAASVGVVVSVSLGALSDSLRDRRFLIVVLACCGTLGYGATYMFDSRLVFVVCMLTLIPLARSVYSLLFAGVRRAMDAEDPALAASVNSTVRAAYAVSWIAVPGLVAWWVATKTDSNITGVFLVAALATLLIAAAYWFYAPAAGDALVMTRFNFRDAAAAVLRSAILVRLIAVSFLSGALTLHTAAYPLIMTEIAGGTMRDVGILAGLFAALEIPFMLMWGRIASQRSMAFALITAGLVYAIYCVALGFVTAPWHLYALAVLNACGAAAILSLPLTYFQDMIRDRPGLSTSLQPVMVFVGGLISSAGFAGGTFLGGYPGAAVAAGLLSLIACAGLWMVGPDFGSRS